MIDETHIKLDRKHQERLLAAIRSGEPGDVREALDGHVRLHWQANRFELPMAVALLRDDPEIMRVLLDAGMNPNQVVGEYRPKPLIFNVCSAEMLALLIERGADVNVTFDGGNTLLHDRVHLGAGAIQLLLDAGAKIDAVNQHGETPLFSAVAADQPEVVTLLLRAGANARHTDSRKKTAVERAIAGERWRSLRALADGGVLQARVYLKKNPNVLEDVPVELPPIPSSEVVARVTEQVLDIFFDAYPMEVTKEEALAIDPNDFDVDPEAFYLALRDAFPDVPERVDFSGSVRELATLVSRFIQ